MIEDDEMNHLALATINENSIRIQRHDLALFDYRGITLATNKSVSNILEERKESQSDGGLSFWAARIRIDKLASNEALMLFHEVSYSESRVALEPAGYLSRKNHSAENVYLKRNGAAADIMSRASNLQDLPVHSLTDVVIHTPYGIHNGHYLPSGLIDRNYLNNLSGHETITRAAGIGLPPILKFGFLNEFFPSPLFTITLDSTDSIDINDPVYRGVDDPIYRETSLDLPAMIAGVPRDARQHGGEYLGVVGPHSTYAVVLRFSEDVR